MNQRRKYVFAAMFAAAMFASHASGYVAVALNALYTSPGNSFYTQMDVYAPNAGAASAPATVIMIHGGGYGSGDKSELTDASRRLADLGYAVVNVNYSLAVFDTSFPQAVTDIFSVIRWVRTTGLTQYQLPGAIIVAGWSAGGTIGSTAALAGDVPGAFLNLSYTHPRGYSVDGLFDAYGRTDLVWNVQAYGQVPNLLTYLRTPMVDAASQALYTQASAITYVGACSCPTVLYHSDDDPIVPVGNSVHLGAALVAAGVPADLHITHGTGHTMATTGGTVGTGDTIAGAIPWMLTSGQKSCGRTGVMPSLGACCGGTDCSLTIAPGCQGQFAGAGTTCAAACPIGACCVGSQSCSLSIASACSGAWIGAGSTCTPASCLSVLACCSGSTCTMTSLGRCAGTGLVGYACGPTVCQTAAAYGTCCWGATCASSVAAQCTGASRLFVASSTACGTGSGPGAPCCIADFNKDGRVTVQDIFAFLSAWLARDASADVVGNGAGVPSVESLFKFLAAWFAKCP